MGALARQEVSPEALLQEQRVEEYLRLVDQGIDLCVSWEEWSDRQFAALVNGDITSLVSVSARQARLVEAFFRLEFQWQQIRAAATASGDPSSDPSNVAARRDMLLAAAERVFAANYRNIRALNALGLLAAVTEPLVNHERAPVYDRQGHRNADKGPVRRMVDREG